jgi:hypothetical protein
VFQSPRNLPAHVGDVYSQNLWKSSRHSHARVVFRLPRRLENPRCLTPTQTPRPCRKKPPISQRDRRLPITPRNLLRHHSFAVPTVHTTHPVNEEDCDLQNRHKLKTTSLLSVVNRPLATAGRADRPTSPPRSIVNIKCQLLTLRPIDLSVHESLELPEAIRGEPPVC